MLGGLPILFIPGAYHPGELRIVPTFVASPSSFQLLDPLNAPLFKGRGGVFQKSKMTNTTLSTNVTYFYKEISLSSAWVLSVGAICGTVVGAVIA